MLLLTFQSSVHFSEMTDISRGRLILTDLVERNSVPIFSSIQAALQCTKILLRRVHVYHTIIGPEHFKIIPKAYAFDLFLSPIRKFGTYYISNQ